MSSPLAIGAVSAVLRNLLDNGIVEVDPPAGAVDVTAVAPDLIDLDTPSATPQINLFLYRVSPNQGWRNADLPSRSAGGDRVASPPLALDLHYLVTAYADEDFQAEILLGYAMHVLHERPVLDRPAIRRALDADVLDEPMLPPSFQGLAAADLADQIEQVKITLEPMDTEEVSRLWSAFQSRYRPSAAYQVSTVLIDARAPASSPLPVLTRGGVVEVAGTQRERGVVVTPGLVPPYPTITDVVAPGGQPSAVLGDTIRVEGHHLAGTDVVVSFAHRVLDDPLTIDVGTNEDPSGFEVTLPTPAAGAATWPAGIYMVTATLTPPDETEPRTTNVAAMAHAPVPSLGPPSPPSVTRDGTQAVTVELTLTPVLRPTQDARFAIGSDTAPVDPHPADTTEATFVFGDVAAGTHHVRLTVDGVDSHLVDHEASPPVFLDRTIEVPA